MLPWALRILLPIVSHHHMGAADRRERTRTILGEKTLCGTLYEESRPCAGPVCGGQDET